MKLKTGILTLVSADNCGSLLQAYALKFVLEKILGIDVDLINFRPYNARKLYRLFHPSILFHPKVTYATFLNWRKLYYQKVDYNHFRQIYLKLNPVFIENEVDLWKECTKYDQLVVGSDQVWNVNMFDFDNAYFLTNYNGYKISYAASLGGTEQINVPEKLIRFQADINSFNCISVREPQGKQILSKLTKKEIDVCVDPTLLIPVGEWDRLAGERIVDEEYIFFYSYNYSDKVLNGLVQKLSQKLKLPVYVINASRWMEKSTSEYEFNLCAKGGPIAFLSLMKYAKYVFVQSLHGSIFAFIFKTNYWFLSNRAEDIIDQRSENILTLLGARHRVIRPNNISKINILEPLVYEENVPLFEQICKSMEYIKTSLS